MRATISPGIWFTITFIVVLFLFALDPVHSEIRRGQKAPVFNLRNTDGELIRPFDGISKRLVLSFFFSECAVCREEIKHLSELHGKYNSVIDVHLIGTSFKKNVDVSQDVKQYIKGLGVDFNPLVDKYTDVIRMYGVTHYPTLLIVEKNGKVSFMSKDYNANTMAELEKIVKKFR
jgi:peroxiredoxin